jgi:di/tricarboxylate transporter
VVALTGAAALLMTGVVRPVEVQGAFASPAIIALASLFVIAYALELSDCSTERSRARYGCASDLARRACGC